MREITKTIFLSLFATFLFVILTAQGATILTTESSDTIGTFRTNVNTSFTNINNAISNTTSTLGSISRATTTIGNIIVGSSTEWGVLSPGTSGKFLMSNGAGSKPSYETLTGVNSLNGSTSSTQTLATSSDTNVGIEIGTASGIHTFTPTWIGTLDISSRTNLNVGAYLGMATDTITIDSQLYTENHGFSFINATTTQNPFLQPRFEFASTLTYFDCRTDGASIVLGSDERASSTPQTAGTDIFIGGTITCTVAKNSTTSFANASMAQGSYMSFDLDSNASSSAKLYVNYSYTKND